MGEIELSGDSYVSGDLVYPPGGTFSVENGVTIEGFKYAWGVSECPWWDYEDLSKNVESGRYPEYFTVSTTVKLPAGSYHFKLLDVEGGSLYGSGVTIFADRFVMNKGTVDVGSDLIFAGDGTLSGGLLKGRLFLSGSVLVSDSRIIGKIVANRLTMETVRCITPQRSSAEMMNVVCHLP